MSPYIFFFYYKHLKLEPKVTFATVDVEILIDNNLYMNNKIGSSRARQNLRSVTGRSAMHHRRKSLA